MLIAVQSSEGSPGAGESTSTVVGRLMMAGAQLQHLSMEASP